MTIGAPKLPGLSPAASAVALAHARLVLRTIRGRMAVFGTPVAVVVALVLLTRVRQSMLPSWFPGGGVLAFGGALAPCLLALVPFAANQFGADRSGLTLALLSPLSGRDLLAGKAAGNLGLASIALAIAGALSALLAPSGGALAWPSLFVAGLAASALAAPLAAWLSVAVPRPVDLSKPGREGNPHALASLVGTLGTLAALAPALLVLWIGNALLGGPLAALGLGLAWCAACVLAGFTLLGTAEPILERRRENLALVAEGR